MKIIFRYFQIALVCHFVSFSVSHRQIILEVSMFFGFNLLFLWVIIMCNFHSLMFLVIQNKNIVCCFEMYILKGEVFITCNIFIYLSFLYNERLIFFI